MRLATILWPSHDDRGDCWFSLHTWRAPKDSLQHRFGVVWSCGIEGAVWMPVSMAQETLEDLRSFARSEQGGGDTTRWDACHLVGIDGKRVDP